MEKLTFKATINAPRQTVWETLWGDDTYPKWTLPFCAGTDCEGTYAITDWQKGSKVLFVDDKGSGMLSRVAENIPMEYMSFEHLGEVKNGVEDIESEQARIWKGAHENYTLTGEGNQTHLLVELDSDIIPAEFLDYFAQTWPLAMNKIKELAEAKVL